MNYAARNGLLLSGFDRHAKHPSAAELRKAAENCLAISQNFSNRCDELQRDSNYTPAGRLAKLSEERAAAERRMQDARGPIDSAAKSVERLRGELKPVPVDPIPSSGVSAENYLKGLAARDEELNGARVRAIEALQPVIDEASAAAGVAFNDLASFY
jgi:hypothetical protein